MLRPKKSIHSTNAVSVVFSRALLPVLFLVLGAIPAMAQEPSKNQGLLNQGLLNQRLSAEAVEKLREKASRPFDQPDEADRYYAEQRQPPGREIDPIQLYAKAMRQMDAMPRHFAGRPILDNPQGDDPRSKAGELDTWKFLGPGNIGGRTRALLVHPDKPRIRWAAGVSGGIWKTENAGGFWRPLADLMPNIAVNSMVMDPTNPDVIYAGTGEGFFREEVRETSLPLRGAGIFKTEDGGVTWSLLAETLSTDFRWVNKIAISHSNPRRLYAATRTGLWRSLNAGRTWKHVLVTDVKGGCMDVALRTDRPADIVFASCGTFEQATIYRNARANTAGSPWLPVLSEVGMGRTSLALAPSNQNVIYALSASYVGGPGGLYMGGLHAVFRSDGAGTAGTWQAVVRNTDPTLLNTLLLSNPLGRSIVNCGLGATDFNSTLGWYGNTIVVDPTDSNVLFAGGIDLFRSDDGGRNWGMISYWYSPTSAHADHHALVFHPRYNGNSQQTLLLGGDGGVYVTNNARAGKAVGNLAACSPVNTAVRWSSQSRNYGVTQFYHGAAFPDGRRYFGGTQDNGTVFGSDAGGIDGWGNILGGDGGYVAIDPRNSNIIYAESQNLTLSKSFDGGFNFARATSGITDPDAGTSVDDNGDFLFIVPFILDSNNPDRLYLGGRRLWRTTNGAATWTPASARWSGGGRLSALAVSPVDPNRMVVGLNDGRIHFTSQALASDANTIWPSARPRAGFVSWVAFDPVNANRVYATYATFGGKHVYTSEDGGASWRQIDGNGPRRLPNLPVHSILADPDQPERLFVGTDLGVFVSTSGGLRWAVENTGFTNTVTETLQHVETPGGKRYLFAFTHGRGAWRVELAD